MKRMMIVVLLISGCASQYSSVKFTVNESVQKQIMELYTPHSERSFCISHDRVYNVLEGGWMSVDMPLCERKDVPVHTHPWWAESFPNFNDGWVWEEYTRRYGNTLFGIITIGSKLTVYSK